MHVAIGVEDYDLAMPKHMFFLYSEWTEWNY